MIGTLGDTWGRKPAMLFSFGLMGASVVGLALTPSYASIGWYAPLLAVLFRLLQGFALGGEVGPTTAFLLESGAAGQARALCLAAERHPVFRHPVRRLGRLCAGQSAVARGVRRNGAGASPCCWARRVVPFALRIRAPPARNPARDPRPAGQASRADGRAVVDRPAGTGDVGQRDHRHLHHELHDHLRHHTLGFARPGALPPPSPAGSGATWARFWAAFSATASDASR